MVAPVFISGRTIHHALKTIPLFSNYNICDPSHQNRPVDARHENWVSTTKMNQSGNICIVNCRQSYLFLTITLRKKLQIVCKSSDKNSHIIYDIRFVYAQCSMCHSCLFKGHITNPCEVHPLFKKAAVTDKPWILQGNMI